MTTYVIRIEGRVQGVGYRAFAQKEAVALGLRGTVRNLTEDSGVEVIAQGRGGALQVLVERLREGPRGCRVDKVDIDQQETTMRYISFEVRPSGY